MKETILGKRIKQLGRESLKKPVPKLPRRKDSLPLLPPHVSPSLFPPSSPTPAASPSIPTPTDSPSATVPTQTVHTDYASALACKLDALANDVIEMKNDIKLLKENQTLILKHIANSEARILARLGQSDVQERGSEGCSSRGPSRDLLDSSSSGRDKFATDDDVEEEIEVVEEEQEYVEEEKERMEEEKEEEEIMEEEKEKEKVEEKKEMMEEEKVEGEKEMVENVEVSTPPALIAAPEPMSPSNSVSELSPTRFTGKQFHRKRRTRKPQKLEDFTNPSGKRFKVTDPVKVNPLEVFDIDLFRTMGKWLASNEAAGDNTSSIDARIGMASPELFRRVLKTEEWLHDEDIDACCFLLRERFAHFPKTYAIYGKRLTIGDCHISWRLSANYGDFCENRNAYAFDIGLMEYYWGSEERYMLPWNAVDDVFFPLNLDNAHWVLCVVHLQEWRIDVYDCDQYLFRAARFAKHMAPICEMLPYLFDKAMSDVEKGKYPRMSLQPMAYHRVPHPTVPRANRSGDCGVFTLMYMEYLTAGLDVSEVTTDHMKFWRQKWAVRLFHRIIEP